MPHVIIKMYKGRSEQQKKTLADKITEDVMQITECEETAVSIAFEEFEPAQWAEKVYRPDILETKAELFKKPGYNPFAKTQPPRESREELMAYVREAADTAAKEDTSGDFNPMSWLDLEIEENPDAFDPFFSTPWNKLSDAEQEERMMVIRRVL